jgi:hypothetical protein
MQSHSTALGPSTRLVKCRIDGGGGTKSGLVPDVSGTRSHSGASMVCLGWRPGKAQLRLGQLGRVLA